MDRPPIEIILDRIEWTPDDPPDDNPDGLPTVTHHGILKIGDVSLRVYQLSDGNRVIDGEDFEAFFAGMPGVEEG
jgi:hypothetical protein